MRDAFSLLEVLIAIGLIALTTTLAAPNIIRLLDRYEAQQALSVAAAVIFDARIQAITTGLNVTVNEHSPLLADLETLWRLAPGSSIEISHSGRCSAGQIILENNSNRHNFEVTDHNCSVVHMHSS